MAPFSTKDVKPVTEVLIRDIQFLSNIGKFADNLAVSPETRLQNCDAFYRNGKPAYECIRGILLDWIGQQGKNATREGVIHALEISGFRNLAEEVGNMGFLPQLSFSPHVMREVHFLKVNKLEEVKSIRYCYATYIRWNIAKPDRKFTGLKNELNLLWKWLYYESRDTPLAQISAMGGYGKTELVKNFIRRYSPPLHCIWLNAENPLILMDSLRQAVNAIVPLSNNDRQDYSLKALAMDLILSTRFKEGNLLIVLDNVDEVYVELDEFVDSLLAVGCLIILTTRVFKLFPERTKQIFLQGLGIDDAVKLVKRTMNTEYEPDDVIRNFCMFLGCHPLGLRQACVYIQKHVKPKHPDESCLAVYTRKYQSDVLNRKAALPPSVYSKSLYTTVELTLAWLRNKFENKHPNFRYIDDILTIICFLPSSGVSLGTIVRLFVLSQELSEPAETKEQHKVYKRLTKQLLTWMAERVSLIRICKKEKIVKIHRLFQTVILAIIQWQLTAENMTEAFVGPAGRRMLWEDLKILTSMWLRLGHLPERKPCVDFPIKMALRGYFSRDFLEESRRILQQWLPSGHVCFLELDICKQFSNFDSSTFPSLTARCQKAVFEGCLVDKVLMRRFEEELLCNYCSVEADCISKLLLLYDTPRNTNDFYVQPRNKVYEACSLVKEGELEKAISLFEESKQFLKRFEAEDRWEQISCFAKAVYAKGVSFNKDDDDPPDSRCIAFCKAASNVYNYLIEEMDEAGGQHTLLYFEAKEFQSKIISLLKDENDSLDVEERNIRASSEANFPISCRSLRRLTI